MPKSRRRDRGKAHERGGDAGDDDYVDDTASILSVISNNSENKLTDGGSEGSGEPGIAEDEYEYKLSKCFEGIEDKSVKSRIDSLKSLRSGLSKKFVYGFVSERCVTLCDGLERCIKRGRGEEQECAAECLSTLLIQVGCSIEKDELFKSSSPVLRSIILDSSMSLKARCKCLETLGLCAFVCMEEPNDMFELMSIFENIFRGSYCLNPDAPSTANSKLHNSALSSWNLLFTIIPEATVTKYIAMYLNSITSILKSNDMELRRTAGESIALMFELGITDENFQRLVPKYNELIELLRGLIAESNKFRAKKDKKVQRSIFRDICKMVETSDFEEFDVQISDYEKITIDCWALKVRYDNLCKVLGTGMNFQLQENPLLRDIFNLGEPPCVGKAGHLKGSKEERKYHYKADFKRRTQHRMKQRNNKMMDCGD